MRVIGLGNVLMGDDAFGPWVVHFLEEGWTFPAEVGVVDVGTPGLDLTPYIAGAEAIVIVDSVKAAGAPGELRSYGKAELLRNPPPQRVSPHDPGVVECLLAQDFAGTGPSEVLLVGAIAGSTEKGTSLTPAVRAAVDGAAAAVLAELERLGVAATPREAPERSLPWWERPA